MKHSHTATANIGLYIALCVVIGFLLAPIPNVELIMLFIFLGGYLFGVKYGALIGSTSGFIFSAFNPWGSGLAFPPLLLSQVICFGFTGLSGGIILRMIPGAASGKVKVIIFGISGGTLTILYHVLISLFTSEFAGFSLHQLSIFLAGGLAFGLWHTGLNILFFAFLTPTLIRISQRFSYIKEFR